MNAADMNLIRRVISKPVTAHAIQFEDDPDTVSNIHGMLKLDRALKVSYAAPDRPVLHIPRPDNANDLLVDIGEWVVLLDDGVVVSMTTEEFEQNFQPAAQP